MTTTDELRDRIEALPCYVARFGEGTYECRHDMLCPACELRGMIQRGEATEPLVKKPK